MKLIYVLFIKLILLTF